MSKITNKLIALFARRKVEEKKQVAQYFAKIELDNKDALTKLDEVTTKLKELESGLSAVSESARRMESSVKSASLALSDARRRFNITPKPALKNKRKKR